MGEEDDTTPIGTRSKTAVAAEHGFRWGLEATHAEQSFSLRDALCRGPGRKTPVSYWKEAITALRPEVVVPKSQNGRMELLAQLILDIDLEPFVPRGRGFLKQCLSPKALKEAAQVWCQYHPMSTRDDLQNLRQTLPYPVLWQHLKRRVLKECGLFVVTAASRRVYFEVPHERPWLAPAKHANVKEGQWRERVIVPGPYGQEPGADDMREALQTERMYVRSAAYEPWPGPLLDPNFGMGA